MIIKDNANTTTGTIVAPDGTVANRPTQIIASDDARLLREYKKLLMRLGLREALYCDQCFEGNLEDGCRAFVRDDQILIECRCKMRFYQGQTF